MAGRFGVCSGGEKPTLENLKTGRNIMRSSMVRGSKSPWNSFYWELRYVL